MSTRTRIAIASAVAVASFVVGRLTAPESLIDDVPKRGDKVASFSGGSIGLDDARDVVPEGGDPRDVPAVEAELRAFKGVVGVGEAYLVVRRRILDLIAETYPALAQECERQKFEEAELPEGVEL